MDEGRNVKNRQLEYFYKTPLGIHPVKNGRGVYCALGNKLPMILEGGIRLIIFCF